MRANIHDGCMLIVLASTGPVVPSRFDYIHHATSKPGHPITLTEIVRQRTQRYAGIASATGKRNAGLLARGCDRDDSAACEKLTNAVIMPAEETPVKMER